MADTRFAVLGTAGHIDHGKTALVKLLTGVDTDRLKEEKERGISIDLGFAHLALPGGIECGIVDVPGHERFVRNMLSGVGGIDLVLLVIAADEGVMPQTREHFDIVRLLGVTRGVVALTKIDMVEPDWVDIVAEEVREYLAGSPFAGAPIVPVSSRTGAGRDELLSALAAALEGLPERSTDRPARLPVDRVFVVEGFGTVVTGTLWQGTLRAGDRVVIEPGGHDTRIRSVQVHNQDVPFARAGQRTAVALHGLEKSEIARGHWVLKPGTLTPSYMVDARIHLLPDAAALTNRKRIRFHLGASELLGRVVLLDREELAPGESAVAQIRLEGPVVADRGDRFVMRSYSPQHAIGGGVILVPAPDKHRRFDAGAVARLDVEERGGAGERVLQELSGRPLGADTGSVARAAGLPGDDTAEALRTLAAGGECLSLPDGRWIAATAFEALAEQVTAACRRYQEAGRYRWGIARGDLKSQLPRDLDAALFDALTGALTSRGLLFRRGDRFRAGSPDRDLKPEEAALLEKTRQALEATPMSPPSPRELDEQLKAGAGLSEILAALVAEGQVVKLAGDVYYAAGALAEMERAIRGYFEHHDELRVADMKELFGTSRRHTVPVLEHFDRLGVTRRVGDLRVAGRALGRGT